MDELNYWAMTFRSGVAKNAAIPALDPAPAIRGNGYKTGCRWRPREGFILSRYNTIDWQCHIDKKRLTQLANITYFQHEKPAYENSCRENHYELWKPS